MVALNAFAADTDREGWRLFSSLQQAFLNLRRGSPGPLPPPVDDFSEHLSSAEKAGLEQALAYSLIGSPETVRGRLETVIEEVQPDEIIVTGQIFDHAARLRSFEIVSEVREGFSDKWRARSA
jgi:alkanesulfonate monooxygenase SsuD/methylene tetrahydromethanopterin reductase-like flavin-dependent oxidoreductase (luciferase family)